MILFGWYSYYNFLNKLSVYVDIRDKKDCSIYVINRNLHNSVSGQDNILAIDMHL